MKVSIDKNIVKTGSATVYLKNISAKYLKTEKKETPKYLMKLIFAMVLVPITLSCLNKSFLAIETILIISFIIGAKIHQKDLFTHILILSLNNNKEHVIISKNIIPLKFIDSFIDYNINEKLEIDVDNGAYTIFKNDGYHREGNIIDENI